MHKLVVMYLVYFDWQRIISFPCLQDTKISYASMHLSLYITQMDYSTYQGTQESRACAELLLTDKPPLKSL